MNEQANKRTSEQANKEKQMKAECSWETNEIIIALDGNKLMMYEDPTGYDRGAHGFVQQGSISLSAKEAKDLAINILMAVEQYNHLEDSLKIYFDERTLKESKDK